MIFSVNFEDGKSKCSPACPTKITRQHKRTERKETNHLKTGNFGMARRFKFQTFLDLMVLNTGPQAETRPNHNLGLFA
jgi:hypothetical protein